MDNESNFLLAEFESAEALSLISFHNYPSLIRKSVTLFVFKPT